MIEAASIIAGAICMAAVLCGPSPRVADALYELAKVLKDNEAQRVRERALDKSYPSR